MDTPNKYEIRGNVEAITFTELTKKGAVSDDRMYRGLTVTYIIEQHSFYFIGFDMYVRPGEVLVFDSRSGAVATLTENHFNVLYKKTVI